MMTGLEAVPPSTGTDGGKVTINVLADEALEIMHGMGERFRCVVLVLHVLHVLLVARFGLALFLFYTTPVLTLTPIPISRLHCSSNVVDPLLGELAIVGGCPRSASLAVQQRLDFEPAMAVLSAVERTYPGSTRQGGAGGPPRVTEMADALLPCKCHRTAYPAPASQPAGADVLNFSTGDGAGSGSGAIGEVLLAAVMTEADRSFCERYTGNMGGREATQLGRVTAPVSLTALMSTAAVYHCCLTLLSHSALSHCALSHTHILCSHCCLTLSLVDTIPDTIHTTAIYPFLKEIVAHLSAGADAGASAGASAGVVADPTIPVVPSSEAAAREAKLSVFSGHDTVIAPVLAGLGVYGTPGLGLCNWPRYASRIAFERWVHVGDAAGRGNGATQEYGVRVNYNGLDVTAQIPACAAAGADRTGTPCPMSALARQVESLTGGSATYEAACTPATV